jgi:hypothetical protein
MAFILANFAPLGNPSKPLKVITAGALGHGAPQHYTYATEDTHATVDTAGYFNGGVAFGGVYNLLNIGDIIHVTVFAAGDISTYGTHAVMDKASGTVDVSNVTVGTVTDSD